MGSLGPASPWSSYTHYMCVSFALSVECGACGPARLGRYSESGSLGNLHPGDSQSGVRVTKKVHECVMVGQASQHP